MWLVTMAYLNAYKDENVKIAVYDVGGVGGITRVNVSTRWLINVDNLISKAKSTNDLV